MKDGKNERLLQDLQELEDIGELVFTSEQNSYFPGTHRFRSSPGHIETI